MSKQLLNISIIEEKKFNITITGISTFNNQFDGDDGKDDDDDDDDDDYDDGGGDDDGDDLSLETKQQNDKNEAVQRTTLSKIAMVV